MKTQTAAALAFSIMYYDDCKGPKLTRSEFATIAEAVDYAKGKSIPLTHLILTEWDATKVDGYGVPELLATCNLDEAAEAGYTSLESL